MFIKLTGCGMEILVLHWPSEEPGHLCWSFCSWKQIKQSYFKGDHSKKKKHNLSRMHKKTTYRPRLFVYIYICDLCMHIIYICIYKLLYKYLGLFAPLEAQDSKVKLIVLPSLLSSVFSKKNHHLLKVLVTGKSMSKWH